MIDLYSDTRTKPTPGMRRAIAAAEVGDEQAMLDPTVNALCERVADLLGKEAAVYLPSGTMCNQIAARVHCRPGDEIILAASAHPIHAESGGPAALAGVMLRGLPGERGMFTADQVRDMETGLLVPEASPERIAAAVMRLLDEPELARHLASQGQQFARGTLTREASARAFSRAFESVRRSASA